MDANEYQEKALRTINKQITKEESLINAVMGLCGESGEAIDIVKKSMFQGHELNKENLIKELGDIAWYLAEACYALDCTLDDILNSNIKKLENRYPNGFEVLKSVNRNDGEIK